jgi:hypothetical protein
MLMQCVQHARERVSIQHAIRIQDQQRVAPRLPRAKIHRRSEAEIGVVVNHAQPLGVLVRTLDGLRRPVG